MMKLSKEIDELEKRHSVGHTFCCEKTWKEFKSPAKANK